jgi:hypothetical protein
MNLRTRNEVYAEVVGKMEDYQRTIDGVGIADNEELMGYRHGYAAEIGYLHARRKALQALITSLENYGRVSGEYLSAAGRH